MDVLLREVRPASRGLDEYRDIELSVDVLTVGSAPDRTIQFLGEKVAAEHAELRPAKSGVHLVCGRGLVATVDGRDVNSARLTMGDEFRIGGNRLALFEPPAGFDVGLEIEPDPTVDPGVFESAFRTDIDKLWLSSRTTAWLASVLILAAFFLIPLAMVTGVGGTALPERWVPTDALWTSGPLHPAHVVATGDDCSLCHTDLFQRVQDVECVNCHIATNDHISADSPALALSDQQTQRCASCHREHNEPASTLVVRDDALCASCHDEPRSVFANTEIQAVNGFSDVLHPEFEAHLLKPVTRPAGTGLAFDWQLVVEDARMATEMSNLKFPHDTHLDVELVRDQRSGIGLGCADCHELSLDREHFVPVTMDSHCIGCHELTFDPTMPDRQLPHGQPLEVMLTLEGQYLRKFSDPEVPQEAVVRRRIPDKDNMTRDCVDTAFNCAAAAATAEITEQFTAQGCITCHTVTEQTAAEIYARYQVHPVRLVTDYYPAGIFDHSAHRVMEDDVGDDACLHCHEADVSTASTELLIPGKSNCLECHSGDPRPDKVTLQCSACHSYHPFENAGSSLVEIEL